MKSWKVSLAVAVVGILSSCGGREVTCSTGTTPCNLSCVDTKNDKRHCGACGNSCASTQVCNLGRCECPPGAGLVNGTCATLDFDGVAACFNSGEVVPFSSKSLTHGNSTVVGTNPQSIGFLNSVMLVLDGLSSRLFQATITPTGEITQQPWATTLGKGPNQVLVDGLWVYSINSIDGTLQVLSRSSTSGAVPVPTAKGTGGFALGTTNQINFGTNSYPNTVAKSTDALWVPLYGGYGEGYDGGQAVVKVSLPDNNGAIKELSRVDLSKLDLQTFAGKTSVARPSGSAVRGNYVYVALQNKEPTTYAENGPGLLARIDTTTNAVTTVSLGSDCLGPTWITPIGTDLAVSCFGATTYDMTTYKTIAVTGSGVVLLDAQDKVASYYSATCPTCQIFNAGRSDAFGNRLVVGHGNDISAIVLDVVDGKLVPVRGADNQLNLCSVPKTGQNFVGDIRALH